MIDPFSSFSDLPDDANVRQSTVIALFSTTRQSIDRWVKNGEFPPSFYLGGVKLWNVGTLRSFINEKKSAAAA